MSDVKSYKELIVWQKSIELVKEIFSLTQKFPRSELYGLVSQMRRAAVAIPIFISKDLNFASPNDFQKSETLLSEVLKMLNSMRAKLNARR